MPAMMIMGSLLLFFGMFFIFLVFPVWMIIHCASMPERKGVVKFFWIAFILVSWILGSIAYGLLGSRKALIQWIAGGLLALSLLSTSFFINLLYQLSRNIASDSIQQTAFLKTGELTQENIDEIKQNLSILHQELEEARGFKTIYLMKNTYQDLMLNQLFIVMMKDGQFNVSEYSEWTDHFNNRKRMDVRVFNEYLRKMEQRQKREK